MAGKLQNEDSKSLAEITGGGGVMSQLLNDTKIYLTALSLNKQLSQAIIDGDLASGGGINYIDYPGAESGLGTWAVSKNTVAAATPDSGFVTSGLTNTFVVSGTTPLRNASSFLYTLGAIGNQVSIPFVIDEADKAKVLKFSVEYKIASGIYADGSVVAWIFDVTNNIFIPISPGSILNSGIVERFDGEFQSSYNSSSYKLVLHQALASTAALRMDTFSVGPNVRTFGSLITDFGGQPWTPTGSATTNTTYTGKWRRVGDSFEAVVQLAFAGATNAFGSLDINMPSGIVIDSAKLLNPGAVVIGHGTQFDSGVANWVLDVVQISTTAIRCYVNRRSGGDIVFQADITNTSPSVIAINDSIHINFKVPILSWSSTAISSSDAITRVTAASVNGDPAATALNTPVIFPSKIFDTHGAYSTSTGRYTCPSPGYLKVYGYINSPNANVQQTIWQNGGAVVNVGATDAGGRCAFTGIVKVSANDLVDVRPTANMDWNGNSQLHFEYVSGPSQILASETIGFKANNTSAFSFTGPNTLVVTGWNAAEYSSGGTFNQTTGVFTVESSGLFLVTARLNPLNLNAAPAHYMYLYKNGAFYNTLAKGNAVVIAQDCNLTGATTIKLLSGENISLAWFQSQNDGVRSLNPGLGTNFFTATRIGNY